MLVTLAMLAMAHLRRDFGWARWKREGGGAHIRQGTTEFLIRAGLGRY